MNRPSPAVFHPGGATLLLGGERDLQVWDLRENQPIAKLAAFGDSGGWLALTSAGHMAGTKAAWERITWRDADNPLEVQRDPHRVAEMSNPAAVGGVLNRSLAAGESLVKLLTQGIPVDSPPPIDPRDARESPPPPDPWAQDRADEARAVELVREAGAELRFDHDRQLTFVKLEGRSVAGPVLQAIPALRHVDRLYVADTGIRDEHLGGLGLMMQVKRLSLWGNPITDRGLLELACMWRLEALDVHDTAVTEASLECLRHIETLRTLIVPGGVDAERLRSAMGRPDLEIIPRGRPTSSPIRPLSGESASRREDAGRYGTVHCRSPGFSLSSAD